MLCSERRGEEREQFVMADWEKEREREREWLAGPKREEGPSKAQRGPRGLNESPASRKQTEEETREVKETSDERIPPGNEWSQWKTIISCGTRRREEWTALLSAWLAFYPGLLLFLFLSPRETRWHLVKGLVRSTRLSTCTSTSSREWERERGPAAHELERGVGQSQQKVHGTKHVLRIGLEREKERERKWKRERNRERESERERERKRERKTKESLVAASSTLDFSLALLSFSPSFTRQSAPALSRLPPLNDR
jgi:hypothetical protein